MNNITRYLTSKKSFSYWFLFPLLELPHVLFNVGAENMLMNVFIGDELIPDTFENHLFVVYKVKLVDDFQKMENALKVHSCHEALYDLDDDGKYRVAIFKLPSKFEKDFVLFKSGKYSKFSDDAKKILTDLYKDDKNTVVIVLSLEKSPILKAKREKLLEVKLEDDDELWSKYTYENEHITKKLREDLNKKVLTANTTFDE